ncbi:hypothetical protein DM02DRAFT_122871 [Periconia macrospinosa]|uniref:COP9 signalosome complex subunit 3 n=1 Tax=Periconia macrospinosa TaxID=97972 RepID=A0A2V1DGP9_9PLEO|nr:hypothetical protein DM02DRAFT_122871 [Periconia macrospinosa]
MAAELLNGLLAFQPDSPEVKDKREYDRQAREFIDSLHKYNPSAFLKGADTPQDPLSVLDPAVNSIAYAFTLRLRIHNAIEKNNTQTLKPGNALWNNLVRFLESFDPIQMRYAGSEYKKLVEYVEQIARGLDTPALALSPIRSAMLRLDPTTGCFTTAHLNFIRLCLESRSYAVALPILDNHIHSFPTVIQNSLRESTEYFVPCADPVISGEFIHTRSGHSDKVTLAEVQEYYVLGAMAYIGARQFKNAHQMLEHVLVIPTTGVANGLMLEAYKKWLLLGCLVNHTTQTPRTASTNAIKQIRSTAKAYDALVEAFSEFNNLPKLKAQVAAGREIWAEDGNTGLVEELVQHQSRSYVSQLSKTFSAIPVSKIAGSVGGNIDETTAFVETLIETGYVNGRLERSDKPDVGAILRFYLDPTQGPLAKSEKQQQLGLLEQTERTNRLAEQVKDADFRLSITKEYIEYLKRQNKKLAPGGGGDAMDVSWDHDDEDMMGDLR